MYNQKIIFIGGVADQDNGTKTIAHPEGRHSITFVASAINSFENFTPISLAAVLFKVK